MRKKNQLSAYILIGIGTYFLIQQLEIPFFQQLSTWPTLLIIIGASFLLHSYLGRDYDKIFPGVVILGLGVHFHGLSTYDFWTDQWGVYCLIIGIAFLFRYQKTKLGLYPGVILTFVGLFVILTANNPIIFDSLQHTLENYWSVALIVFGFYLLFKKR